MQSRRNVMRGAGALALLGTTGVTAARALPLSKGIPSRVLYCLPDLGTQIARDSSWAFDVGCRLPDLGYHVAYATTPSFCYEMDGNLHRETARPRIIGAEADLPQLAAEFEDVWGWPPPDLNVQMALVIAKWLDETRCNTVILHEIERVDNVYVAYCALVQNCSFIAEHGYDPLKDDSLAAFLSYRGRVEHHTTTAAHEEAKREARALEKLLRRTRKSSPQELLGS